MAQGRVGTVAVKAVIRPGGDGMITDAPSNLITADTSTYAQDLLINRGVTQQRWGWSYVSNYPFNNEVVGAIRAKYSVPKKVNTVVIEKTDTGYDFRLLSELDPQPAEPIWQEDSSLLPMNCGNYHGEQLFCFMDGKTPMLRYSGSETPRLETNSGKLTYTAGEATVKGSGVADVPEGQYAMARVGEPLKGGLPAYVVTQLRVVSSTGTDQTLEDVIWDVDAKKGASEYWTATADNPIQFNPLAEYGWPGQIENWEGTCKVETSGAVEGFGTKWLKYKGRKGLALLYRVTIEDLSGQKVPHWVMASVKSITDDTHLTLYGGDITGAGGPYNQGDVEHTKGAYKLCSVPTWTSSAEHKNSLFGSGAESNPSRVWISPPDWNPALPPEYVPPEDISVAPVSEDAYKYTLDYIDVGGEDENEPVLRVVSTSGPLLALKRGMVYGIFGAYPNFEVALVSNVTGLIHHDGVVSDGGVAYWADRNGVWTYADGVAQNISIGKIQNEWRALMDGWVEHQSTVTMGTILGHLVVSVRGLNPVVTGRAKSKFDTDNPTSRTYLYSIAEDKWVSRVSNIDTTFMSNVRIPGEPDGLFFAEPGEKIVGDFAPAISGVQTIQRDPLVREEATSYDDNTKLGARDLPQFDLVTSDSFTGDFVNESRLLDFEVTADTDSDLVAETLSQGGKRSGSGPVTLYLASQHDDLERHYGRVGRSGRRHQIRLKRKDGANDGPFEVHEISVQFRASRPRS